MGNKNQHNDYFFSCDWGTSSFRLSLVDSTRNGVIDSLHSPVGIKTIVEQIPGEVSPRKRRSYFFRYLQEQIGKLESNVDFSPPLSPVLISGMASSSIGIKELPYAALPFPLSDPQTVTVSAWIESTDILPHKLLLISGLCSETDIMRGEETQLLGLASAYDINDATCIMPGTHSKHVIIQDDTVIDFKTFMTGELFELLSTKSILSDSIQPSTPDFDQSSFKKGVHKALEANLLHALFSIRANQILKRGNIVNVSDFLSGLIIGTELKELQNSATQKCFVTGTRQLQDRYSIVLKMLDIEPVPIEDADDLATWGHLFILNKSQATNRDT